MTRQAKMDAIVSEWMDSADLDTIYEYAEQKYVEWLSEQSEEFINETHKEFCNHWVPPEATKKVIET